jgi:uncharacterized repeat protein (TIGR03803 family)
MKRIFSALGELNWSRRACLFFALCAAPVIAVSAQTLTTRVDFDGTNGANPAGPVVQGIDGNLYGVASQGGANGYGTVFTMTHGGVLTTLHSFDGTDGSLPNAVLLATNGDFYGTTYGAGPYYYGNAIGPGTVFKITPGGKFTSRYTFCTQTGCADGEYPGGGLVQATNGDLYGITSYGGAYGGGTIFEITPAGKLMTLYSFCSQQPGCTDGETPSAGLIQATNGSLYGTTEYGGAKNAGTVFKMTPGGKLTTLYSFCSQTGCTDGSGPVGAIVQATDGSFYGTTSDYGTGGYGTVFKMTPGGRLTTLYSFCSQPGCTDGYQPYDGLIQATDGNFYGTTPYSAATCAVRAYGYGCGTIFKMTPSGELTTIFSFDGANGLYSYAGLLQATSGNFYSVTFFGGGKSGCPPYDGCGTI